MFPGRLTLHPATTPSPPAQTMVSLTMGPHQSGLVQVAWSTTGSRACCRFSAMGPPAGRKNKPGGQYTSGGTFTFTFRPFSRHFYPKRLTISTFVISATIYVGTVKMFIEPSASTDIRQDNLFPIHTAVIASYCRCYTNKELYKIQHTLSAYIKCQAVQHTR